MARRTHAPAHRTRLDPQPPQRCMTMLSSPGHRGYRVQRRVVAAGKENARPVAKGRGDAIRVSKPAECERSEDGKAFSSNIARTDNPKTCPRGILKKRHAARENLLQRRALTWAQDMGPEDSPAWTRDVPQGSAEEHRSALQRMESSDEATPLACPMITLSLLELQQKPPAPPLPGKGANRAPPERLRAAGKIEPPEKTTLDVSPEEGFSVISVSPWIHRRQQHLDKAREVADSLSVLKSRNKIVESGSPASMSSLDSVKSRSNLTTTGPCSEANEDWSQRLQSSPVPASASSSSTAESEEGACIDSHLSQGMAGSIQMTEAFDRNNEITGFNLLSLADVDLCELLNAATEHAGKEGFGAIVSILEEAGMLADSSSAQSQCSMPAAGHDSGQRDNQTHDPTFLSTSQSGHDLASASILRHLEIEELRSESPKNLLCAASGDDQCASPSDVHTEDAQINEASNAQGCMCVACTCTLMLPPVTPTLGSPILDPLVQEQEQEPERLTHEPVVNPREVGLKFSVLHAWRRALRETIVMQARRRKDVVATKVTAKKMLTVTTFFLQWREGLDQVNLRLKSVHDAMNLEKWPRRNLRIRGLETGLEESHLDMLLQSPNRERRTQGVNEGVYTLRRSGEVVPYLAAAPLPASPLRFQACKSSTDADHRLMEESPQEAGHDGQVFSPQKYCARINQVHLPPVTPVVQAHDHQQNGMTHGNAEVMFEQDAKIRALPPVTPTLARMIEDAVEPAQLVPDCSERIVATMRKVQEQAPPNCIAQDKWEEQEQTSQCTQAASRMFLPRREGQDENASAALVGSMTWLATRSTRAAYRLAHTSRASAS